MSVVSLATVQIIPKSVPAHKNKLVAEFVAMLDSLDEKDVPRWFIQIDEDMDRQRKSKVKDDLWVCVSVQLSRKKKVNRRQDKLLRVLVVATEQDKQVRLAARSSQRVNSTCVVVMQGTSQHILTSFFCHVDKLLRNGGFAKAEDW